MGYNPNETKELRRPDVYDALKASFMSHGHTEFSAVDFAHDLCSSLYDVPKIKIVPGAMVRQSVPTSDNYWVGTVTSANKDQRRPNSVMCSWFKYGSERAGDRHGFYSEDHFEVWVLDQGWMKIDDVEDQCVVDYRD